MGVVYEAWDRQHQMRLALKTLAYRDSSAIYRFKQEFRNLTGLVHRNLATLYELFSVDDLWFFTMEFVNGCDLLTWIRFGELAPVIQGSSYEGDGAATERQIARAQYELAKYAVSPLNKPEQFERLRESFRQIVEGLIVLHAAGKLHRDIKPNNVLVTRAGRAVILDFGLSTSLKAEGEASISGTISYMAPEQAMGSTLTPAADFYAAGVMLYEALVGQLPYDGVLSHVFRIKQDADAPRPSTFVDGVPPDLDELCGDLLRRDPDHRPTAEEILARLGGVPKAVPVVTTDDIPLVGREEPLSVLRNAFFAVREGKSRAVFVHGSSGAGKSFLVERALQEIARNEKKAVILTGRCYETESVPYKALDSLIDALSRYLVWEPRLAERIAPRETRPLLRLFPVLGDVEAFVKAPERPADGAGEQEIRRRAASAFRELLARMGDRVPLVLVIDDLHWGDVDSGNLLAEILRGPDPPVLLLVCIYRSEYARSAPILQLLLSENGAGEGADRVDLPVDVLSPQYARKLALELLDRGTAARDVLAETIARESDGVPYFVHELVKFVQGGSDLPSSVTLQQLVTARLDALPIQSRRLLDTIAVAGQPIRQSDAWSAAELAGEERLLVAQLRSQHLVRSTGPGDDDLIETYHDRVRETLVERLPQSARKLLHQRLAVTLERSGSADPETLAIHFLGCDDRQRAADYFLAAAEYADRALAFDRAAKLYRESLLLRPSNDPRVHELYVRLGDALANAGRGREAASAYEAALPGAEPLEAIDLRRRGAYQLCISGHLGEGRAAMRDLLRENGVRLPESRAGVIAQLLWNRLRLWFRGYGFRQQSAAEIPVGVLSRIDVIWSASAGLSMSDTVAGAALQVEGLLAALEAGEIDRIARSLAWEATHHGNLGSSVWAHTAKLLEMTRDVARRSGKAHALGMSAMTTGIAEFLMGRFASSVPLLDDAATMFRERCTGVAWEIDTAHAFAGYALCHSGQFAELSRRTPRQMKEAEERGDLFAYTTLGTFMQPHVHLQGDDVGAAREVVERSRDLWPNTGFYLQTLCGLMADALIDVYEGEGERAWRRFTNEWRDLKASQLLRSQMLRALTYSYRGRAALAAAMHSPDREIWIRRGEEDARRVAAEGASWCVPYSQVMFANAAVARGDHARAVALLHQSAAGFDEAKMASHAASARWMLGRLVGGDEGAELLRAATAAFAAEGVRNPEAMARMHNGVAV